MNTMIAVENNNVLEALRGFLKSLLESGAVEALFVPLETVKGTVIPALVTDAGQASIRISKNNRAEELNPLAQQDHKRRRAATGFHENLNKSLPSVH